MNQSNIRSDAHQMTCPTLIKAVEWTQENGQNPASMMDYLKMPEATILRICLRRWGTTAQAYDSVLKNAGWYHSSEDAEDGDLAVIGGESIVALNLATHLPREIIQLLAFREHDDWQICTNLGMSPIDWTKSKAMILRTYKCQR